MIFFKSNNYLDHIALPDSYTGESKFRYDSYEESNQTNNFLQDIGEVIVHELAHKWVIYLYN